MGKKLPALKIGDLIVDPPIVQGGMGVRVSRANLAAAVANEGGVGVIAGVGLGKFEDFPGKEFVSVNDTALREEIQKARNMMTRGVLGVNLMVALSNYEELVRTSAEAGIDVIISGAGLPLDLPKYIEGKDIKLVPIVSSARALKVIAGKWKRNFNKLPDAVVVEGAKAGGHIGFDPDEVIEGRTTPLEELIIEVIEYANTFDPKIPVIAAGGVFDGKDIAKFINLGASGVQMGTRFVCTDECDVHQNFKQAYIDATEDDLVIIKSPVGMPGRVINSKFVENVKAGKTTPTSCNFRCLKSCEPKNAPYCIAKALANAAEGNLDEGFVFAGSNAYRCNEIVSVKQLMDEVVAEAEANL